MTQPIELQSAAELAAQIRARKLSSLELCDAYLQRIAQLNPALNAVITLDAERARQRARALDERQARGEPLGPLHGLPITIKDTYETAGMRTTCGTREWSEHVPTVNATAVQRLLDAGAVVMGKTNVPPYAADVQSYNELFGATRNPWNLERTPGGSSGGAAAAVATGLCAFELGSDIGGSIRTPCGWTGLLGHKPTHGIVPMLGHLPPAPGSIAAPDLAVSGPIARSAADLSLVLDVVAGPDAARATAFSFALPPPRAQSLRELRVGVWLEDPDFPLDHEVARLLDDAVRALEGAGARIDRTVRPAASLREIFDTYLTLLTPVTLGRMSPQLIERLRKQGEDPDSDARSALIARAALQPHYGWLTVHERRARLSARFAQLFREHDVLLCPITPVPAIPLDQLKSFNRRSITVNGETRSGFDLMAWITAASACHLPATAAPVGRTRDGLPVGIQIIGPYLEDRTPIAFAGLLGELIGGYTPPPNS